MADGKPTPSAAKALTTARRAFLAGRFDEARTAFHEAEQDPACRCEAAAGFAALSVATSDPEGGLERLRTVEKSCDASAAWHAAMAALLESRGDFDGSIRHGRRALAINAEHHRARWQLGRVLERTGRIKEAIEVYRPCDDAMTSGSLPEDAESLTHLGLGFLRFSVLTRTNLVQRTRHVLQEVFGTAVDFADAGYWPARLATAELLLAKHNLGDAQKEFEALRASHPHVVEATVGLCRILLEAWNFDECEKLASEALKSHPRCVPLLVLLADLRMTERKYAEAAAFAEQALKENPRDEAALGVLAAAKLRGGDAEIAQSLEGRVREFNPAPATFHYAVGFWLSAGRQFTPAEAHLKKAIEFAPWWPEPRTDLGQICMERGEEADARKWLESAFELDSFNQHTFNVLELLDRIDKFARLESDHFVVKYDEVEDWVVAPYFSRELEAIHADVCGHFNVTLDRKTIIELFPDHQGFSVRITGRPFIGTIGACTGNVIAMTSPRGRPPFGRFNWASVLRHEFTHTVTLAATENRIPHWLTEGLAVYEEPSPRSWEYKQLLTDALRRDRLFTLESIDWGFARPRRPTDRSQAYAQSEWMAEFIIERWKYPAILELLGAFRDGKSQERAFQDVLKISTRDFDAAFRKWAADEAAKWGIPATPVADPKELAKQLKEKPDDAGLLAEMAYAELLDGQFDAARASAEKALKIAPRHVTALEVMCHLLVGRWLAEDNEAARHSRKSEAAPYIEKFCKAAPHSAVGIKYMGFLEQADEQWSEAIQRYKAYQERMPEDPESFRRLAAIHLRLKQYGPALTQLEQLFRLVEDEPAVARQIARLYEAREEWAKAADWYQQAIKIDPYDPDTHGALADALFESGRYVESEREFQVVIKLLPDEPLGYEGLAHVYQKLGDLEKSRQYAKRAAALSGSAGP